MLKLNLLTALALIGLAVAAAPAFAQEQDFECPQARHVAAGVITSAAAVLSANALDADLTLEMHSDGIDRSVALARAARTGAIGVAAGGVGLFTSCVIEDATGWNFAGGFVNTYNDLTSLVGETISPVTTWMAETTAPAREWTQVTVLDPIDEFLEPVTDMADGWWISSFLAERMDRGAQAMVDAATILEHGQVQGPMPQVVMGPR
jgi:hypothetical protein